MGFTTAEGLILTGQGTTNDVTIKNDADTSVIQIPTGTDDVNFTDDISLKSDSAAIKFGADEEITLTHNHNAGLTLGGTTPTLTIGDAGAEDTKIVFDGNAQDFHIGLDDSADSLTIGLGSTLGTTSHMVIDANGIITKPLQPAFLATPASAQNGIATGNATTTLAFGTEVYDQNGDYNNSNNTFTAPVTGRYYLNVHLRMDDLDIDVDFYELQIVTSNRTYIAIIDPDFADQNMGYFFMTINVVADMDAADTALAKIRINGGDTTMGVQTVSHYSACLLA